MSGKNKPISACFFLMQVALILLMLKFTPDAPNAPIQNADNQNLSIVGPIL